MRNKIQIFGCALKFKLTDEGLTLRRLCDYLAETWQTGTRIDQN